MNEEILIQNAKVFDSKSNVHGDKKDILISKGVIVDKLSKPNEAEIINGNGLIAFPGGIDLRSYFYQPNVDYIRTQSIQEPDFITIPIFNAIQKQYLEHGILSTCEMDVPMTQTKLSLYNMTQNSMLDHFMILDLGSNWSFFSDIQSGDKTQNIAIVISKLLSELKGYGISANAPYHQQYWKLNQKTPENPEKVPLLSINQISVFKDLIKANLTAQIRSSTFISPYDMENQKSESNILAILKNICEEIGKETIKPKKSPIHLSMANHYFTEKTDDLINFYSRNPIFEMDVCPLIFGSNRPLLTNQRNIAINESIKSKSPITTIDLEFDTENYITTRNLKVPDALSVLIWSRFLEILLKLKKINQLERVSLSSNAPCNMCLTDYPKVFNWLLNSKSRMDIIDTLPSSLRSSISLQDISKNLDLYDLSQVFSYNPAKTLGMDDRKGHLGIGADADVILFKINDALISSNDKKTAEEILKGFSSANTIIKRGTILKKNGEYNTQINEQSIGKIFWNQGKMDKVIAEKVLKMKESFYNKHFSMQFSSLENKSDLLEEII
jgi:formylmethanofuran dehydrogenase subunit A